MAHKTAGFGFSIVLALTLAAGAEAQGWRRGGMANQASAATEGIVALSGQVTSVNMAAGQRFPSFSMNSDKGDVQIMVGPYRLLVEKGIQIEAGQTLTVQAFPSARFENTYVATAITTADGRQFDLRHDYGMPLRAGRGPGRGFGTGRGRGFGGGACFGLGQANVDLTAKITLAGKVESTSMGPGQGYPSFVLLADGKEWTIVASPFQALRQAGFEIRAGDEMTVTAYPSLQYEGAYVASELQNMTTGKELRLRDENGLPLGLPGGRGRP